jgi:prepilin-type N-terminal cleavage/methylation domain-containing protein/prepilin-type processing-associated H-X9-DG protein
MVLKRIQSAFTLVELLVVLVVLSLLSMLVAPSIQKGRDAAHNITCLSNLRNLGKAMGLYHSENYGEFWPCRMFNKPKPGMITYFWGSAADPVDPLASPFLKAYNGSLSTLWCPKQAWGDYVPQGNVSEPTTNYGYNAWCLDPPAWGRTNSAGLPMRPKKRNDINRPNELFVFADSAMYWAPGGVGVMQNSTHLEPLTGTPMQTPTTHFRHGGRANALCVDGSADSYGSEGWVFKGAYKTVKLGFVGTKNQPHYDQ